MRRLFLFTLTVVSLSAAVISDIRYKISAGDLRSAEALAEDCYRANGANSEYAAAVAWLARGALVLGQTDAAARYLAQTKTLTAELMKTRHLEEDHNLESAIGTSIEVEARLMVARGQRDQAIRFLQSEQPNWKTWWVAGRIQKNLNLLTLEGQPAPDLDPAWRGGPILLFLWAHWCGDCKAQGPVIARIQEKYEPRGLRVIAPTRLYGDTPHEDQEIERVWKTSYAALGATPHPISDAMMLRYGVTSTPTLVLIDRKGIVRLYTPTRMSEAELARRIEALL